MASGQSTVTEPMTEPLGIPSERQGQCLIHDDTSCTETLEETSQEVSSEITAGHFPLGPFVPDILKMIS